jgi:small subunit ribosomal protein MRP21
MDLMKARETMMRSSQSIMPLLAQTAHREPARRMAFVSRHCRAVQPMNASTSRSFATSMRRQQDDDNSNAASALKSAPDAPARRRSVSEDISSILDGALDMKKGTPTTPSARTSRFPSRDAQSTSSPARAQLTEDKQQQKKKKGSIDDLMAGFLAPKSRNIGNRDIAGSLNPRGNRSAPPPVPQPAPMKLGPTLGRTVHVDNQRGIDVARAFRTMEIQVAKNSVRKEFARQKFHERPGKKRKRLHSERWRKRFKAGFKATVKRVLKMRKQGW